MIKNPLTPISQFSCPRKIHFWYFCSCIVVTSLILNIMIVVLVQSLKSCPALCDLMKFSTPSFPVLHYLPEFAQTHVHWVGGAIQPSHPLLPPSPLALNLCQHQGFSSESALLIRWPKYWSFIFSIKVFSMSISFSIVYFDLPALWGILKILPQHHNLKASIIGHSAVFMVQLSHLYMTIGKTITLTIFFLKKFLDKNQMLIVDSLLWRKRIQQIYNTPTSSLHSKFLYYFFLFFSISRVIPS